ncbi:hypothetical protein LUZ60_017345 [Juncus effusus]|nr:hypothetical protein LUZ60_017345 [Juncus effusus]
MLDAAASFVLDNVKSYALKEAEALAAVGDRIMLMNDKLEWLQTFIKDADQKRQSRENTYMAVWVRQTRDITYQVEDVVDDYLRKAFLAGMEQSWWKAWWNCMTHPFTQFCTLHDLVKRMDKIEKRLAETTQNKDKYGIKNDGAPSSLWTSSSTTKLASWDNLEDDMIGFDDYEQKLEELLLGPKKGPRTIISIVGESGIGKTKLGRKVFHSKKVQKHFKIRTWSLLPPKTKANNVLHKIFKKANGQERCEKEETKTDAKNDIRSMLVNVLDEDRYLVVVDGISSITECNIIKDALPDVGNGSRVLLIMRPNIEGFEQFVDRSLPPLELKHLNEEESKQLFVSTVFGKNKNPKWFEEKTFGKDVFTLTQGLPLAIVVLAGLLRSKESPYEWDLVFTELKSIEKPKSLLRLLVMSFNDLPHDLKSCFLYFGALPETDQHDAYTLVRMWIAEGFVKPKKGSTMEEIGQSYLKELVSRCMVKLLDKDAQGGVKMVAIHDVIHAFIQSEALETNFFEIHDSVDVTAPNNVRRLSIQNYIHKHVPLMNSFPKLRSLVCDFAEEQGHNSALGPKKEKPKYHSLKFLHVSKFLRVIHLQGLTLNTLPKEIGKMIHLRYLGVRHCGKIQLPSSIGNLIYLQTFDVQDTDVSEVNEAFWQIPTLRHVLARTLNPPKLIANNSNNAEKYNLNNLQMLHGLNCENWNTSSLEKLINIRSLELQGLTNSQSKSLIGVLGNLELLVNLKLKCKKKEKPPHTREQPSAPEHSLPSEQPSAPSEEHSFPSSIFNIPTLCTLQSLEIDGKLENVQDDPEAMLNGCLALPNLTKLTLRSTQVSHEYIIMLAKLPRLSFLKLDTSSYIGTELEFSNGFHSLRELQLGLTNLKEWRIDGDVMPQLTKLCFWNCGNLTMIPDRIKNLAKLEKMVVYNSQIIAQRIKKHNEDHHKVRHIPNILVRFRRTRKTD